MRERINQLLRLRPGEAGLVIVLGFALLANSVATQVSGIAAISGFLDTSGVNPILIVWVVDSLLILVVAGLQSLIVDRFDRLTLIRWMTFGFALIFAGLRLLFSFNAPGWLNYALLYLLADIQWLFFPLVFWILANDIFEIAQSKRVFPLIASWGFIGKLLGIGIAAVSPLLLSGINSRSQDMLVFNVLIYLGLYMLLQIGLGKVKLRQTAQKSESVRESLAEGWGFVREVPAFRYLTVVVVAIIMVETFIEFRFLALSDRTFTNPDTYQTFYSLYRLGWTLASIVIQALVTSRLIEKIGLKNTFVILPITALVSSAWMLAMPGIVSAVGGAVLLRLQQYTIDESARKSFQALVPEERRGRVSMFMDSILYAAGAILGCAITGAMVWAGGLVAASGFDFYLYMGVSVLMAFVAIWAVLKMRAVYDTSLLNWRLKRRQRGASVLDKLDFES